MGRDRKNEKRGEHFARLFRNTIETPAWRALTLSAKALYPLLLLEWKGNGYNNNGRISLSVRQASEKLGIGVNAAARAFHDLQAKGFIVVTTPASLGVKGQGTSPEYELTEIAMPGTDNHSGRKLFTAWKEGHDFHVQKAAVHNPRGSQKKQNPVIKLVTARNQKGDV